MKTKTPFIRKTYDGDSPAVLIRHALSVYKLQSTKYNEKLLLIIILYGCRHRESQSAIA